MALADWTRTKGWDISSMPTPTGDPGGISGGTHVKFVAAGGGTQLNVQVSGTEWSGVTGSYDSSKDTLTGDLGKRTFKIVHNSSTKKLDCIINPAVDPSRIRFLRGFGFDWLRKLSKRRNGKPDIGDGPSDAGSWTAIEGG